MDNTKHETARRVNARDAALQLLNRLTVGAAMAAVAGVGLFGAVSAATIPGTSASTSQASGTSTTTSSSSSSTSSSSSSSLQPSSGVSSSSGSASAVSGASN
jgi:cellulose 1,4-beta-cellobiosidase